MDTLSGENATIFKKDNPQGSIPWVTYGGTHATTGATGELVPPAPPRVYLRGPAWSPRGDLIAFEHGELRGNVWTLTLPEAGR